MTIPRSPCRHAFVATCGLIALAACTPDKTEPAHDTAADIQAISAVRDREIGYFAAGNADSLTSVLTTDIQMMPPNEPAVVGAAAVRTWAQDMAKQFTISARYTGSSVTVAGDIAVEQYTAEMTVTPKAGGGAPLTEKIKGVHVYRRQPEGGWKIAQDVWNADAAPAPPPRR